MRWKWTEKPCESLKSQLKWLKLQVEFSSRSLESSNILELFFLTPEKTAATKLRCCFFWNLGRIFNNTHTHTHTSGGDFCFCLFEIFAAKNFTQEALKNYVVYLSTQRISTTTASIATMWSSTSAFLKLRFQWAARACGQGWGGFRGYRAHERNRQSHRAFFWTLALNQILETIAKMLGAELKLLCISGFGEQSAAVYQSIFRGWRIVLWIHVLSKINGELIEHVAQ